MVKCNSLDDIGENNYKHLINNLDILYKEYYMKNRVNLGINLYDIDKDYTYIMELLLKGIALGLNTEKKMSVNFYYEIANEIRMLSSD